MFSVGEEPSGRINLSLCLSLGSVDVPRCCVVGVIIQAPVAPGVQLVTSKPSDVGTRVQISVQSNELGFFLTKKKKKKVPNKWTTINSLVHKIRLHGRRGKRTAEPFPREKLG